MAHHLRCTSGWRTTVRRLLLWLLPVAFSLAAARSVDEAARADQAVDRDGKAAVRVVTRELVPNGAVKFAVEPGAEVLRLVLHAFRHGAFSSPSGDVAVTVKTEGAAPPREERYTLALPTSGGRAKAELDDVLVGDPISLSIDLHGVAPGSITLTLESAGEADGLLVRAYRRERGDTAGPLERRPHLSAEEHLHLVRQAGLLDWLDLDPADRATLVGARWRKVAPVQSTPGPARDHTIVLSPSEEQTTERASTGPSPRATPAPAPPAPPVGSLVTYFRTSVDRAAVVLGTADPIVLRVAVREPLHRSEPVAGEAVLIASLTGEHGLASTQALRAPLTPSLADHYEAADSDRVPSTKVVWHILVPARGRLVLRPAHGELDLSLSELDPEAPPRPLEPHPPSQEPPAPAAVASSKPWGGFVARRPSNGDDFEPEFTGGLRLAGSEEAPPRPEPRWQSPRLPRPASARSIRREGVLFVPAQARLRVEVPSGPPSLLPLRIYAASPTTVLLAVDGGAPRRRTLGVPDRITTTRSLDVVGETRATLVIGDDLAPGTHWLTFVAQPDVPCWIHLPWSRPERVARSAWVAGDFSQ
jgi:hypothetical protein